jgi:hypothetical protein
MAIQLEMVIFVTIKQYKYDSIFSDEGLDLARRMVLLSGRGPTIFLRHLMKCQKDGLLWNVFEIVGASSTYCTVNGLDCERNKMIIFGQIKESSRPLCSPC